MGDLAAAEHEAELAAGVRRFGAAFFHPVCAACRECVPIRVPVREFRPSRTQRRVWRKNADLEVQVGEPWVNEERLDLYRRFHRDRQARRGWPAQEIDPLEYFSIFVDNCVPTLEFRYRLGGRLVAVAYVDESPSALNSIYAFTDPALAGRRLGTYDILAEIEEASRRGKEHLYLGYYVADCTSMAYKRAFRPCELLINGSWVRRAE